MTDDTLRAALERFFESHGDPLTQASAIWCDGRCEALNDLRAALAASAPDEGPPSAEESLAKFAEPRFSITDLQRAYKEGYAARPAVPARLADVLARRFPGNDDFSDAAEYVAREYRALAASATDEGPSHLAERFDHDGTFRHHHDSITRDPIWWEYAEQFGGEKREHRHEARPAVPAPDVDTVLPEVDTGDLAGGTFQWGYRAGWNSARAAVIAALSEKQP